MDGNNNPTRKDAALPVGQLQITIVLDRVSGQVQCTFPECDLVTKLGILETAKIVAREMHTAKAEQQRVFTVDPVTRRIVG